MRASRRTCHVHAAAAVPAAYRKAAKDEEGEGDDGDAGYYDACNGAGTDAAVTAAAVVELGAVSAAKSCDASCLRGTGSVRHVAGKGRRVTYGHVARCLGV